MRRTAGSMPAARAASLCRRRLSSPKQKGMTPGGEHAKAFVPPSIVAPHQRDGRRSTMRRNDSLDVSGRNRWHIRGNH